MENNIIAEKTVAFAIRIVKCSKYLQYEKNEYIMSKQLLRCGTSIGANIHESIFAQSKADFISKLSISLKEASEASYWLTILNQTDYIDEHIFKSFKKDIDEIIRIIISAIKTAKKNAE